jgi:hypothetical protein
MFSRPFLFLTKFLAPSSLFGIAVPRPTFPHGFCRFSL